MCHAGAGLLLQRLGWWCCSDALPRTRAGTGRDVPGAAAWVRIGTGADTTDRSGGGATACSAGRERLLTAAQS